MPFVAGASSIATPSTPPTHAAVTGSWQIVPSPAIDVSQSTFGAKLNAVGAVSATDVWAVGYGPPLPGEPRFVKRTLIEHWDGTAWSIVPSADPPVATPQAELFSVLSLIHI